MKLDIRSAAIGMGVSVRTLMRYIADGAPHQKRNGRILIDPDEVLTWRAKRVIAKRLLAQHLDWMAH